MSSVGADAALALSPDEVTAITGAAAAFAAALPAGRGGPHRALVTAAQTGAVPAEQIEALERVCTLALETGKARQIGRAESERLLTGVLRRTPRGRAMAEEVMDRVCRRLGRGATCRTRDAPLGPEPGTADELRALGLGESAAQFLASRHPVADVRPWLSGPSAADRIAPGLPYLWAEVSMAVESEMAQHLDDVMVRRLGLFYESGDQGLDVAAGVAERMGAHLGWDAARRDSELRAYRELVADHRKFREGHDR